MGEIAERKEVHTLMPQMALFSCYLNKGILFFRRPHKLSNQSYLFPNYLHYRSW